MKRFSQDSKEFLLSEWERISQWEKDQKDLWFWEKIGRLPFALLDKITPQAVHNVLGKFFDELGSYIQTGGEYLIQERQTISVIARKAGIPGPSLSPEEIGQLPLSLLNEVAETAMQKHKQLATMQGATTGFGGIFTFGHRHPRLARHFTSRLARNGHYLWISAQRKIRANLHCQMFAICFRRLCRQTIHSQAAGRNRFRKKPTGSHLRISGMAGSDCNVP